MPDTRDLSREEVAALRGVSAKTLQRLERQHAIPILRVGRQVRYDAHALQVLEAACRSRSNDAPAGTAGGYPAPSPPPAARRGSASDAVLAAMTRDLRERKQRRSKRASSGTPTSGNVLRFGAGARP